MSRLWVTLEYAQCRAACVMDKQGQIYRLRGYDAETSNTCVVGLARDTFSRIVENAHIHVAALFPFASSFAKSLSRPGEFLGGIAARENGANDDRSMSQPLRLCLGEAVELVILKGCQFPHDRLIVLDILLEGQQTRWVADEAVPTLPTGEAEACSHIWRKALGQGDYSPLLLQPRERVPESNPGPGLASWLVAHSGLEGFEWRCGNQLEAPRYPPAFGENGGIRVQLQLMGKIEAIHYMDMEMAGGVDGVDWAIGVLEDIARAAQGNTVGTALAPRALVDGLNRIFPFHENHERIARHTVNMAFTFEEKQAQDPRFEHRIQDCLARYRDDRAGVAQEISDALGLETNVVGGLSRAVTRLTLSRYIAHHRKSRSASIFGEPVCRVRCSGCGRVTPFRLDLRDTGEAGHLVYRIPGLTYTGTMRDGVGLVLGPKGRITGRMRYGPPACGCNLLEEVELF